MAHQHQPKFCSLCASSIFYQLLPAKCQLSQSLLGEGHGIADLGSTTPELKMVKAAAMTKIKQLSSVSESDRGVINALASTY